MSSPESISLYNFYQTVKFTNPHTAALMHADLLKAEIFSTAQDKTPAIEAAKSLRLTAQELPESLRHELERALTELGFL